MQLLNSDQSGTSTHNRSGELGDQALAFEMAQDEIELLREQIASLQQYLYEQAWELQAVEHELHETNHELERMNAENHQLVKAELMFLRNIKEFAKIFSSPKRTDRKALIKLLDQFSENIASSKKIEPIEISPDDTVAVFRSNRTSKSDLQEKLKKKQFRSRMKVTTQRLHFKQGLR